MPQFRPAHTSLFITNRHKLSPPLSMHNLALLKLTGIRAYLFGCCTASVFNQRGPARWLRKVNNACSRLFARSEQFANYFCLSILICLHQLQPLTSYSIVLELIDALRMSSANYTLCKWLSAGDNKKRCDLSCANHVFLSYERVHVRKRCRPQCAHTHTRSV